MWPPHHHPDGLLVGGGGARCPGRMFLGRIFERVFEPAASIWLPHHQLFPWHKEHVEHMWYGEHVLGQELVAAGVAYTDLNLHLLGAFV